MRSVFVVVDQPLLADHLALRDRLENVGIEHLLAVGPVKTLDEGVLIGLAGLDEAGLDPVRPAPLVEDLGREFRPVVEPQGSALGQPWISTSCPSTGTRHHVPPQDGPPRRPDVGIVRSSASLLPCAPPSPVRGRGSRREYMTLLG